MTSKRMFFVMVFILTVTVLGTGAAYYFSIIGLKETLSKVSDKQAELDKIEKENQVFNVSKNNTTRAQDTTGQLEDILPSKKDQSVLVEQLKYILNQSGLSSNGFSFQGGSSEAGPDAVSLTQPSEIAGASVLTTTITQEETDYSNLLSLLNNFDNSRRPFRVISIDVNPSNEDATRVSFTVIVEAFLATPPGAPKAPAAVGGAPATPPPANSKATP